MTASGQMSGIPGGIRVGSLFHAVFVLCTPFTFPKKSQVQPGGKPWPCPIPLGIDTVALGFQWQKARRYPVQPEREHRTSQEKGKVDSNRRDESRESFSTTGAWRGSTQWAAKLFRGRVNTDQVAGQGHEGDSFEKDDICSRPMSWRYVRRGRARADIHQYCVLLVVIPSAASHYSYAYARLNASSQML
ncbi:hypothetical protein OE88DRAFT_742364 [Heliocybe sulcata]|uniref:Uncharacterized protein n=1 Tax=Heliocybe sulcata TaxID=5364 RepID=A0A5C3MS56_9AGAM|nr:hypothetical protein OE88DRAFT_742364 [Heliocybe sulcata]